MVRALVPVDGSANSDRAVRHLIRLARGGAPLEIHLLNVQEPIDAPEIRRFRLPREIRRMQLGRGADQLRPARARLDKAGIRYETHTLIGDVARTIAGFAQRRRCNEIIMGTRGMTSLANLLLGSVATKVIHLARVPVTLVK